MARAGNARDERLSLCDLLDATGPAAPTLCDGWDTADLAAHLVLRERRPAAAVGILGGPLAAHTRRVQAGLVASTPFRSLVELIRTGPPVLSVYSIPGAAERLNLVEYFVHHEDVRRAQPGWEHRELSQPLADELWRSVSRAARYLLRRAPVGVELARVPDRAAAGSGDRGAKVGAAHRVTVRARTPVVTVAGAPGELIMWLLGRTASASVTLEGGDADVRALQQARRRV